MGVKKKTPSNEGKIIYVKVTDIDQNPYRDLTIYAIQEERIAELMASMDATGFWETVIGRWNPDPKKRGRVQIAFGHHRIEAATRKYTKPGDKIPIIIRELSDDLMRQMMIRENRTEYKCHPAAIDDAVKASRNHLRGDREHATKTLSRVRPGFKRVKVGAPLIAKDTGFPVSTVEESLRRLDAIENGRIDPKALYKMPNTEAARRFIRAVETHPTSQPYQKTLAEHIVKRGPVGKASIDQAFMEFVAVGKPKDPQHPRHYEVKMMEATNLIKKAARALYAFDQLGQVTVMPGVTKEDIPEAVIREYYEALEALKERAGAVGFWLDREPVKPMISEEDLDKLEK